MRWYGAVACVAVILMGCGRQEKQPAAEKADSAPRPVQPVAPVPPADPRAVIVAFGDSLTAGQGVDPGLSYVDFLQKELDSRGLPYRVVNQGISGDTTSGGAARVSAALSLAPRIVILELGANDGLRGLPVQTTRENLDAMIDAFQRGGATVVLCGMTLPRNYGAEYIRSFEAVYRDLAEAKQVTLIRFFLEGVATRPALMQGDGMHPNAEGNAKVARNVLRQLLPLLAR